MEHRPVRETLVQATTTAAAAAVHRCAVPCEEKLFHASCTCDKSPVAKDGETENCSSTLEELVSPPSSSYVQPNESRLLSTATSDDGLIIGFEDPLIAYVENVENVILNLLERISILPFLLKHKKTIIAMFF